MISLVGPAKRVQTGPIHTTPAVLRLVDLVEVTDALQKHLNGDWGRVSRSDIYRNEYALIKGGRVTSAFQDKCGVRFWITTEADRSKTTVLLPRDNRDNTKPKFIVLKTAVRFFRMLFR